MTLEYVIDSNRPYEGFPRTVLCNGIDRFTGCDRGYYAQQGCEIMPEEEFAVFQDAYLDSLCGHWMEVSEERYEEMLNVLPPVDWREGGFFMLERDIGDVSGFYQQLNSKYYTSRQRISTDRETILASLKKWLEEKKVRSIA